MNKSLVVAAFLSGRASVTPAPPPEADGPPEWTFAAPMVASVDGELVFVAVGTVQRMKHEALMRHAASNRARKGPAEQIKAYVTANVDRLEPRAMSLPPQCRPPDE